MGYFGVTFFVLCCVFYRMLTSMPSTMSGVFFLGILLLFSAALTLTRRSAFQIVIWLIIIGMSGVFHVSRFSAIKDVKELLAPSPEQVAEVIEPIQENYDSTVYDHNTLDTAPAPIVTRTIDLTKDTDLLSAINAQDLTRVRQLLAAGANPNARTPEGKPVIHAALLRIGDQTLPILEALVDAGADVNSTYHTFTPLMLAAATKQEKLVDFLLVHGADVNAQQERTALMFAAESGDTAIAQKLIQAGADVNKNYRNYTALQEAISRKNLPMVQLFLDNGADVNFGITWVFALKWGTPQITEALVKKGMVMPNDTNRLALKAYNGELESLKTWFADHPNNEQMAPEQKRVLQELLNWAIAGGQTETARFLLAQNVSPDLASSLESAAIYGRTEIVKALFSTGVSFPEKNLLTALRHAIAQGHIGTAQALLAKGVNPNKPAPNSFGISFLQQAAFRGDLEMVKVLLAAKADPNQTSETEHETALHKAVEAGNLEIVKTLVAAGANLNVENTWGQTPLKLAEARSQQEIAAFLRQAESTK